MSDMDPSTALLDMGGKNESLNRSADPIPDAVIPVEETVLDVRIGRPLHVNVSVTMHDIQAHLMKVSIQLIISGLAYRDLKSYLRMFSAAL